MFTGYAWTGRLLRARTRLSYALRGPRDNPEKESFFGRLKVENRSLILGQEGGEERSVGPDRGEAGCQVISVRSTRAAK